MVKYLSTTALLTASAIARTQGLDQRTSTQATGTTFTVFLEELESARDSSRRNTLAEEYVAKVRAHGHPVIEDSTVYFLYLGTARRVGVPGDLNGWSARMDTMRRVP